ncbi:hypothetical protein SODG_000732 [Sodalis praecaptivus]
MIALQFRDCNIVASDISAASLAFQQRLAAGLAVANITFRQEDLLRTPYRQCFDFISCVGVVHHLPAPMKACACWSARWRRTDCWN